jgi:hypothetical protein
MAYIKYFLTMFMLSLSVFISSSSLATDIQPSPDSIVNSSEGSKEAVIADLISDREFWLSVIILTFGTLIIVIEYFLLRGVIKEKTEEIARTYTVTLIIIGTLVLISAGLTSEQISPALGLFGTIAGYLLGRSDRLNKPKVEVEEKSHE